MLECGAAHLDTSLGLHTEDVSVNTGMEDDFARHTLKKSGVVSCIRVGSGV